MLTLLDILLRRVIRHGSFTLIDADRHRPPLRRRLVPSSFPSPQGQTDRATARGRSGARSRRGLQCIVRLEMIEGRIYDFLELFLANLENDAMPGWTRSFSAARYSEPPAHAVQSLVRARRNVAHHYDIDGAIYDLFLDSRPAVFLRLFRGGCRPRGSAARQETPPCRQARASSRASGCSTSARVGAGLGSISPRPPAATSPA